MAVGRDHKLSPRGEPVAGNVGHDRVQQGRGGQSVGEAIRHWYGLQGRGDFEKIDVEVIIHNDGHFILIPTGVKMRSQTRPRPLEKVSSPLSFHRDHQSKLWKGQIAAARAHVNPDVSWAASQLERVVSDHQHEDAANIHESDLLRAAGALWLIGMRLGTHLGKGYDCQKSSFAFHALPPYPCPVELKKRSRGFEQYQFVRYPNLPRAVVLCMEHNYINPPPHIDFVELPALAEYLAS